MSDKNFSTQHNKGFMVEGKSIEEIKEMQKKGIVKANQNKNNNSENNTGNIDEQENGDDDGDGG